MDQYLDVDPLSLIHTHKQSFINGLIKRLKVPQLRYWLQFHGQDWKGHKEVIAKRLKSLVRREVEKLTSPSKRPQAKCDPEYRYYFVMDIEATCEEPLPPEFPHEIIELPVVVVDADTKEIVAEFRELCRPIGRPILSDFCVSLTGITQEDVNGADTFAEVLPRLLEFLRPYLEFPAALVTDSPYDVYRFLLPACLQHSQTFPDWGRSWVNLRKAFSYYYKVDRMNLGGMLSHLGLEFDGRPHCGLDDARNIARILLILLNDGCTPIPNEGLTKAVASALPRHCPDINNQADQKDHGTSSDALKPHNNHQEHVRKIDLAMLNLKV